MFTIKSANNQIGGLSNTDKMPGLSFSIPVEYCNTGSTLIDVEGSACFGCYADASRYRWSNVANALENRYQSYIKDRSGWVQAVAYILNNSKAMQNEPYFRWFDAGDIIDLQMLEDIYEVCRLTPQIKHWLPTKEFKWKKEFERKPNNLVIRVSAPFKNTPFKPGIHPTHSVVLTQAEYDRTSEITDTGIKYCPAHLQAGQCQDCRTCWDEAECVAYRYHGKKSAGDSDRLLQIDLLDYRKAA